MCPVVPGHVSPLPSSESSSSVDYVVLRGCAPRRTPQPSREGNSYHSRSGSCRSVERWFAVHKMPVTAKFVPARK